MGAGAAWMLKRAKLAKLLLLDLPRNRPGLQATLESLMQVSSGFSRLTALSLRTRPHGSEDLAFLTMALAWLVGQSKGIVFLSLDLVGLPFLPSLSHIRHLQLGVAGGSFPRLAATVASLATLQTLYLDGKLLEESESGVVLLDLHALTQLESVMLDGAIPNLLFLPEGTALHVIVYSLQDARNKVWPAVGDALTSFRLETDACIYTEEQIPQWMLEPIRLEKLVLALQSFGRTQDEDLRHREIQLKGALLYAKRFCLDCTEGLHVQVPKGHEWKVVNLHSGDKLYVGFDSITEFASSCREFTFRYAHLEGIDILSLASHLTKCGMRYLLEQPFEMDVECHFSGPTWAEDLRDTLHSACRCGACKICCRIDNFQGHRIPPTKHSWADECW